MSCCCCLIEQYSSKDCHGSDLLDYSSNEVFKPISPKLGQSINYQYDFASESSNLDDNVNSTVSHDLNDNIIVSQSMRPSSMGANSISMQDSSILADNSHASSFSFVESNHYSFVESNHVIITDSMADTNNSRGEQSQASHSQQQSHLSNHSLRPHDQPLANCLTNLGLKCKGFRIGHINIQGLSNKIDQIRLLLTSEQNQIQILGLSETKLNDFHPGPFFEINGYQKPLRRDRGENAGGGLMIYVKNGVCCKRRPDLENGRLECIWLEVKPVKSKPFLVGHIYRPPNSGVIWNELFEDCLENVLKEEKELYILGDINRDLLNNQINKAWSDYIEPFGLTQLVSEATRVTSHSRTLIDHIYSNCPENVNSLDVPKIGLSDHFPVFFTRKLHVHPTKCNHFTISYRSFKDFDETKFFADLQAVPWDVIQLFDHTDDILEAWTDLFLEVVDKNVPLKQHRVKRKNQPDWITPDILDAIKCRDRHKSLGNENQYKYWRNKVVTLIRKAKQDKYQTYIETNKGKPGSIFKIFQDVGAGKGCCKQSNISSIKNTDGKSHTEDPTEIANAFNNFFVNIASKIKEPVNNSGHDKLKEFCQSKISEDTNFEIPNIEKGKVLKYLSNIDISKAKGTDNIGPRILKLAAPYIAGDISFICNHSINTSSFPNKWKEAKVSPLHKSGPHDEINNYRPISILPVLSKVLEKHVSDSLTSYLNENNLLHQTQSGFRSQHSCETALTHMVDSWLNAIDNGLLIGVVLADFKKAFDLVDHEILLDKLKLYGIRNETLSWFNSYLMQRQQQVSI